MNEVVGSRYRWRGTRKHNQCGGHAPESGFGEEREEEISEAAGDSSVEEGGGSAFRPCVLCSGISCGGGSSGFR